MSTAWPLSALALAVVAATSAATGRVTLSLIPDDAALRRADRGQGRGTGTCNASAFVQGGSGSIAYRFADASSAAQCCTLCSEDDKCWFFTYKAVAVGVGSARPAPTDPACHLKSGAYEKNDEAGAVTGFTRPDPGPGPPPPAPPVPPAPPAPPAPPPLPPAPNAPNILLLFPDQWRYDWDGYPRENQPAIPGSMLKVPTTRSVAARGTRFTTVRGRAPVCVVVPTTGGGAQAQRPVSDWQLAALLPWSPRGGAATPLRRPTSPLRSARRAGRVWPPGGNTTRPTCRATASTTRSPRRRSTAYSGSTGAAAVAPHPHPHPHPPFCIAFGGPARGPACSAWSGHPANACACAPSARKLTGPRPPLHTHTPPPPPPPPRRPRRPPPFTQHTTL